MDEDEKVAYYELISPKNKDILVRSHSIYNRVKELGVSLGDIGEVVDLVVIEGSAMRGLGKVVQLAELNGAVVHAFLVHWNVVRLAPTSLKKFATGNGRAQKDEMQQATPDEVLQMFSDKYKKHDDLIDAYWLARYGLTQIGELNGKS